MGLHSLFAMGTGYVFSSARTNNFGGYIIIYLKYK